MPEEPEVETRELQEKIEELQEDERERDAERRRDAWTRYVALTTAILAVFAAVGALESGSAVNEAMMAQIRSSDIWNEYQADRQKELLYTLQAEALLDRGARLAPAAAAEGSGRPGESAAAGSAGHAPAGRHTASAPGRRPVRPLAALPPDRRLQAYVAEAHREADKQGDEQKEARSLEAESAERMHHHHAFAQSVALIQVAIALGAVAALTRIRPVWLVSIAVGLGGIVFFVGGLLAH